MKQLIKSETTITLFSIFLITYLVFSPLMYNFAFAANQNTPFISHHPVKAARYGEALVIKAHIGNPSAAQKVTLVLNLDGSVKRGKMVEIASAGQVPVTVRALGQTPIFSGPGSKYSLRGYAQANATLYVSQVRNGHYRIKSEQGLSGFVAASSVQVVSTGKSFGVSLPASLTNRESLTYHIELLDRMGNTTTTDPARVKLLTPEQVQNLIAKRNNKTAPAASQQAAVSPRAQNDPVYKKGWFWLGLLAVGGGTYFLLSQNQSDSDTGTLDVSIEWE